MGEEPARKYRPWLALAKKVGPVVAVYPGLLAASPFLFRAYYQLEDWLKARAGAPGDRLIDFVGDGILSFSARAYVAIFYASVVLFPLALAFRATARRRLRERRADPIDRFRHWMEAHPKETRALTFAPPALWSAYTVFTVVSRLAHIDASPLWEWAVSGSALAIVGGLATLPLSSLVRRGLRAFVAPTIPVVDVPQRPDVAKDEISFAAVAVTLETQVAVAAMLALTLLAFPAIFVGHAPSSPFVRDWVLAYVAVALGGAAIFRHASRVSIGVDGVLVKGTSRTRFFAYRDFDSASAEGSDLVFVRKGRVALRLQLHGEDATKRDAVLARIRDAIAHVKEGRGAATAQLVSSATADDLARAAGGGAHYRGAALTREQLWALVEGPAVDASARQAAAAALAKTSDGADRARLRVAAEHCAAPEVRVAIARLADEEPESEREPELRAARR
ncbi:MAG: hypothetical protein ACLQVI_42715 [Polyangiaceae bacterium]